MMKELAAMHESKYTKNKTSNGQEFDDDEENSSEEMMREIALVREDITLAGEERERLLAKINKKYAVKRMALEQEIKDKEEKELQAKQDAEDEEEDSEEDVENKKDERSRRGRGEEDDEDKYSSDDHDDESS
jgi:hypothetical protein